MDALIDRYISVDPQIQHGKPCFRGTRIPVYVALELLEGRLSPEAIVGADYYPELTLDHIRAALHFAAQYAKNQEYLPLERPAQTGT